MSIKRHENNYQDFGPALLKAIQENADPRFVREQGDKVLFNGFWRGGAHQNVCAWLDKGTWSDAKTGEGGGCKEFADIAFNMSLPEFLKRYGQQVSGFTQVPVKKILKPTANPKLKTSVDEIWRALVKNDEKRPDLAEDWLSKNRAIMSPRKYIKSGFTNLSKNDINLFEQRHHKFIMDRLSLGPQLVAPIRGLDSDRVQNLFFRAISDVSKEDKSRLLTGAGGWGAEQKGTWGFGMPHLIHDFPNLILCEGMADYFVTESLLGINESYLPIGTANAAALSRWADWLVDSKYLGRVTILHQIDKNSAGEPSAEAIGPAKAAEALQVLLRNNIKAGLFNWPLYLRDTSSYPEKISDIADSLTNNFNANECEPEHLQAYFMQCLKPQEDK